MTKLTNIKLINKNITTTQTKKNYVNYSPFSIYLNKHKNIFYIYTCKYMFLCIYLYIVYYANTC